MTMSEMVANEVGTDGGEGTTLALVDCDVHPNFERAWNEELSSYFSPSWRIRFGVGHGVR
jgi:hypothetical protein